MPQAPTDLRQFASLIQIISDLRGPEGCPWDKQQTHQSLTRYAIEETAEFVEAVEQGDPMAVCEELGDMLLQVVLNSEIARQSGHFDIYDVIESISRKMVDRHPHVFAGQKVKDAQDVQHNWQQLKAQKKKDQPLSGGLPKGLPALLAAQKIGEKTVAYKFDWSHVAEVIRKVEEELGELKSSIAQQTPSEQQAELGDLLFSVAQLARHLKFDAEQALRTTNQRFETRFIKMLEILRAQNLNPQDLSSEQLEQSWQQAKKECR